MLFPHPADIANMAVDDAGLNLDGGAVPMIPPSPLMTTLDDDKLLMGAKATTTRRAHKTTVPTKHAL